MFTIRMGVPEMLALWNGLRERTADGTASANDVKLYKKLGQALYHLSRDPRYPGLCSHEIGALSARYGMKVWESYLENGRPAAGRIFWVYGPDRGDITVIGLEPHPNDKADAYRKITLSATGESPARERT